MSFSHPPRPISPPQSHHISWSETLMLPFSGTPSAGHALPHTSPVFSFPRTQCKLETLQEPSPCHEHLAPTGELPHAPALSPVLKQLIWVCVSLSTHLVEPLVYSKTCHCWLLQTSSMGQVWRGNNLFERAD